jgi:hypothetical protein
MFKLLPNTFYDISTGNNCTRSAVQSKTFWDVKPCNSEMFRKNILSDVDSLLGGHCEISGFIAVVASQQPTDNRVTVFSAWFAKQQLNSNRGTVFSVRSMLKYYKQDNWRNELIVGTNYVSFYSRRYN